jgi:hypothetical protein
MANMYKLEEYEVTEGYLVNRHSRNTIVRLYTNGEYRCSCTHFNKMVYSGDCHHIRDIKNGTAKIVSMQRFSYNECHIK